MKQNDKYTIEEIKELVNNPGVSYKDVGKETIVTTEFVRNVLTTVNIIKYLVEEVEDERKHLITEILKNNSLLLENKRLREALEGK